MGAEVASRDALVVVPAFNEEASVGAVIRTVLDLGLDVVVVDDGSADGTSRVARRAGAEVLRLPVNLGVGGALRLAFRFAWAQGYGTVVQCDGDGQHDPEYIPNLLSRMEESGADLVVGSRFADGGEYLAQVGLTRRWAMRLFGRVASRATGTKITDATSGFRAIRGPLLHAFADAYPAEYLGDTVEALVLAGRAGYVVAETPVRMRARGAGTPSAKGVSTIWYTTRVLAATAIAPGNLPSAPVADR